MGLTRNDIIRRKARCCSCGKLPIWIKPSRSLTVLSCPDPFACVRGGKIAKGPTLIEAIETWNEEVQRYDDTDGKRY